MFPSPVTPTSNISKIAASYLTLPPELRQPILHHAIDNDIVLFREKCEDYLVAERDWFPKRCALLEIKKVCLHMKSVFHGVHPQVEEDFEGVFEKFEIEVEWMAEVIMKMEQEVRFMAVLKWCGHLEDWRRWA